MTVTIKDCHTIKPAEPTPNTKMSLPESDQIHGITHAPTIYFYRPPLTTTDDYPFASAVETLKTSLSQVLVHFYPLVGRLHWITDGDRLELECNSMGALIFEAESDGEVDDYGDFKPTVELRKLIPFVDYNLPMHELPLLLVQLTKFKCGGMSLGIAISHILADGSSALHFIIEWSRIARGLPLECVPFLDRTTPWQVTNQLPELAAPLNHSEFSPPPLLMGRSDDMEERGKETDLVMLKLSKTEVERIQRKANDDHDHDNNNGNNTRPFSRFEALNGYIWKCSCKARKHKREQLTSLRFAVDGRNRLDPPLPKCYFGNAVFQTLAISNAGELMEKPLSYASSRIREAIKKMTNEYIRSSIDFVKTQHDLTKFRVFHTLVALKELFMVTLILV